ncbi:hypothetical protein BLOT_015449 [Blomia tropicalis]|nr:hypothetical protein BLOT_015449 [Blomia tropicalis]
MEIFEGFMTWHGMAGLLNLQRVQCSGNNKKIIENLIGEVEQLASWFDLHLQPYETLDLCLSNTFYIIFILDP